MSRQILSVAAAVFIVFCLSMVGYRLLSSDWTGEPDRARLEVLVRSTLAAVGVENVDEKFVDRHTFKALRGRAETDTAVVGVISSYEVQADSLGWKMIERSQDDERVELVHCSGRTRLLLRIVDHGESSSLTLEAAWSSDPFSRRYCP